MKISEAQKKYQQQRQALINQRKQLVKKRDELQKKVPVSEGKSIFFRNSRYIGTFHKRSKSEV